MGATIGSGLAFGLSLSKCPKVNPDPKGVPPSTHPYLSEVDKSVTASGAYQINIQTYKDVTAPEYGIGTGFSPAQQDRMAVALLQDRGENVLALIRKGEIETAVTRLKGTWASFPGGRQQRKGKNMNDLLARYRVLLN